ncbi:MAG TPA: trypsin-like peptidase domain-containing protein [Ktedonobacteraceae bacterium]|nr:trypsin-like peptidase domain-containing protein [Ktedonobacteraceae bacterium]
MQQEEDPFYQPYSLEEPYSFFQSHTPVPSAEVPDTPPVTPVPMEQGSFAPPGDPLKVSLPPRKQPARARAIILLVLVLALIFGVGLFAGWQFSSRNVASATAIPAVTSTTSLTRATIPQTQLEVAIAKIEPAVVELQVTTIQGQQIGSGVIIDAQGNIVTNNHVVNGAQVIEAILNTGSVERAQLAGIDATDDLAVVRIRPFAHMAVAQLGDSSRLTIGQEVLAVGNPLGITETATHGIISALNRSIPESDQVTLAHAIQTDAAINPGNSGGALVNLQGELIGIPTVIAVNTESNTAANGVSFAIPSNQVKIAVQHMLQQ